jgi:hypothetical protein
MNWQHLIDWQITSFGGNPAVMVEVVGEDPSVEAMTSATYAIGRVEELGLVGSIKVFLCTSNDDTGRFKPGAVSYAFIHNRGSYDATMESLRAFYPLVHFNSLMAGSGIDDPEVKRALDDFCEEKGVPWKVFSPGVWSINHCHRLGQ